eukprot:893248-Amphidinium_carterae.1
MEVVHVVAIMALWAVMVEEASAACPRHANFVVLEGGWWLDERRITRIRDDMSGWPGGVTTWTRVADMATALSAESI